MTPVGHERPIVEIRELVKHFAAVRAVDGISLTVAPGEIYALLGLNGAGKTTAIRALLGMMAPTSGSVSLWGQRVRGRGSGMWDRVGYLVETPASYPELTVAENLDIMARLKRLAPSAAHDVTVMLGLQPYAGRRARHLSLGNQQRLGLAKALLGQPQLLVLDEPANGLDPAGVTEIRQLLKDLASAGTAILLSSHILTEVAKLATRIGIIHHGKMITEMAAGDLHGHVNRWLEVRCLDQIEASQVLTQAGFDPQFDAGMLLIRAPQAVDSPDRVAALLVEAQCPLLHLAVREEDLETLFLRLTGQESAS